VDALEVCKARVSDEGGGGPKVVLFFSLHSLVFLLSNLQTAESGKCKAREFPLPTEIYSGIVNERC
jgi:hypothetical protein